MSTRRINLPTSPEPDAEFVPFVFMRHGHPYKVAMRKGSVAWLHTWHHDSGQWCMYHALPNELEIASLRCVSIPTDQAEWYEREQRRRHPHYYQADGTLKR